MASPTDFFPIKQVENFLPYFPQHRQLKNSTRREKESFSSFNTIKCMSEFDCECEKKARALLVI
jgi:hypothetical protein